MRIILSRADDVKVVVKGIGRQTHKIILTPALNARDYFFNIPLDVKSRMQKRENFFFFYNRYEPRKFLSNYMRVCMCIALLINLNQLSLTFAQGNISSHTR